MYNLLHQYLIIHKQLDLPGIGLLQIVDIPARYTAVQKKLYAPYTTIRCKPERMQVNPELYTWVSTQLAVSEIVAKEQFDSFINNILQEIETHQQLLWQGIGLFKKDDFDTIYFFRDDVIEKQLPNIVIEKGVGLETVENDVKTNTTYIQSFWERKNWWLWAFIITSITYFAVLIYFLLKEDINFATLINFI